MNVNWKEAILQAQKKIDQVLDIRPETVEVEENEPVIDETVEQNCSSPSQGSEPLGDDIVMLEPVLPPFLNNRYIGDDIQTIISSDIEHLTRASSRTASPERIKLPTDFEKELSISLASFAQASQVTPVPIPDVNLPNPEDILNQAISGLRKELVEYKKANQILQHSHAHLEREMEESRFTVNEKVVNMLNEEREHYSQEISQLKLACSQAVSERIELEEKYKTSENIWSHTKKVLHSFRHQIIQIKGTLKETEEAFASDFETFGAEMRRILHNQAKRKQTQPEVIRLPCSCEKDESRKVIVKHEATTQTLDDRKDSQQFSKDETSSTPTGSKSNVTDLLQIIEQLEVEKKQLLLQRKSDKREIEKLKEQLNETLIMHGEKIEQLDEILVDNEELKSILKQQALALTHNKT